MGTRFAVPNATSNFEGAKKVQTLFAKLFGVYELSATHKGYDPTTTSIPLDISGAGAGRCALTGTTCSADAQCEINACLGVPPDFSVARCEISGEICRLTCTPNPCVLSYPQIRQVNNINTDPAEGGIGEGATGFTIVANGADYSLDPKPLPSPVEVTAALYAYNANGEQMPLREVRVDWLGDPDNSSGAAGKYKNHKAICKKASDPGYNFGDSPQACVDDAGVGVGYFTFNRSLTCTAGGLGLKPCGDPSLLLYQACWDENGAGAGVGACRFSPRVYVRDNWDWCFGGPTAATGAGRWGIGTGGECNLISANAWLPFGGRIIVKP